MGILQKIKEFFQKEEPEKDFENTIETKEIVKKPKIEEISSTLKEKQSNLEEKLQEKINILYNELNPNLEKLEQNIKKLSVVDISKNKAEEKIKKMTEIGRQDYLTAINKLLLNLKNKDNYKPDYIKDKIEEFAKQSAKSDFKVTLLIGKEVENIRNDIMKIRKLEEEFNNEHQKLLKNKTALKDLQIKNKEKESKEKIKTEITKEIEENKKIQEDQKSKLDNFNEKIEKIKKTPEFKEKASLITKLEAKETLLKEEEFTLKTLIDAKVLEKYAYIESDEKFKKQTQSYIKDPISAVKADPEFKILNILDNIKAKVKENELKIKDKSLGKLNITQDTLSKHKDSLLTLNQSINELQESINKINENPDLNLAHVENQKTKLALEFNQNKSKLNALRKKQNKIDNTLLKLQEELIEEISLIN